MGTFIYDPIKGYIFVMENPTPPPERKTAKIIDFEWWQDHLALRKLAKPKEQKSNGQERSKDGKPVEAKPTDA